MTNQRLIYLHSVVNPGSPKVAARFNASKQRLHKSKIRRRYGAAIAEDVYFREGALFGPDAAVDDEVYFDEENEDEIGDDGHEETKDNVRFDDGSDQDSDSDYRGGSEEDEDRGGIERLSMIKIKRFHFF